jgi:hypothetical protein
MKLLSLTITFSILAAIVWLKIALAADAGFKCEPVMNFSTVVAEFRCYGKNSSQDDFEIKFPYCSFKAPSSEALCVNDDAVTTQHEFYG